MKCRNCGTDIADRALICFRCGVATTEAKYKAPVPIRRPPSATSLLATLLAVVLLIAGALYLDQVGSGDVPRWVSWSIAAAAAVLLVVRVVARRRR